MGWIEGDDEEERMSRPGHERNLIHADQISDEFESGPFGIELNGQISVISFSGAVYTKMKLRVVQDGRQMGKGSQISGGGGRAWSYRRQCP